jgi:DNA-binding CsgD family transcriptional regulator
MSRITERDRRAVLSFQREIYRVSDFDAFVRQLFSALSNLIPTQVNFLGRMRKETERYWIDPGEVDTPTSRITWYQVMHEHPLLNYYQRTHKSRAHRITDFLPGARLHNTSLYCDHLRRLQVEDVLGFEFNAEDGEDYAVGAHLDRRFNDHDRLLMEEVRPHIIQAACNAIHVTRITGENAVLTKCLDRAGHGVIALSADRRIRFATSRALRWITAYFGAVRENDRLPATLDLWVHHHDEGSRRSLDMPPPREPLLVDRDGRSLLVRSFCEAGAITLLLEERCASIRPESLAPLALTRRESEILALVALGSTNVDIATTLCISPRTVQTHLEHIFHRIGVENRTAAAAKAIEVDRLVNSGGPDEEDAYDFLEKRLTAANR